MEANPRRRVIALLACSAFVLALVWASAASAQVPSRKVRVGRVYIRVFGGGNGYRSNPSALRGGVWFRGRPVRGVQSPVLRAQAQIIPAKKTTRLEQAAKASRNALRSSLKSSKKSVANVAAQRRRKARFRWLAQAASRRKRYRGSR